MLSLRETWGVSSTFYWLSAFPGPIRASTHIPGMMLWQLGSVQLVIGLTMKMIRTACIAATLAAITWLPLQSAGATSNNRIELVVKRLQEDSRFSGRDFSFAINRNGSSQLMFKGLAGVRAFNNYGALNDWAKSTTQPQDVFAGGGYQFTHSVLDSYFSSSAPQLAPVAQASTAPDMFNGGGYTFTHSVLGSYFDLPAETPILANSTLTTPADESRIRPMMMMAAPIPEPATWALMIGGFTMAGLALRMRFRRAATPTT